MDLIFWYNIYQLGEEADLVRENANINLISKIFRGLSLFHYFAGKPEVSEVLCNLIELEKSRGNLTKEQERAVLLILLPDTKGHNALNHALDFQSPKSYERYL
jgi:hypothetical protein